MKKWAKVTVAVVVVVVLAVAGTVLYITSSPSNDPCAGISTPGSTNAASVAPNEGGHDSATSVRASEGGESSSSAAVSVPNEAPIPVVAAENFWGSLVSQLGGNQTAVLSIVTDPNTDPHEYEANASDARAITSAQFVIVNGVGYDDWAINIIQSDGNSNQTVLNVGILNDVGVSGGIVSGNPHMWYNPVYVNRTVAAMYSDLVAIRPSATGYFEAQYAALNVSLGNLYGNATAIRTHFAGSVVASTESIFVYLANFTDLDLVSPPAFMEAVAEGNDPPTQSVVEFQCQLESGHVSVLIYNEQTVTPTTNSMKSIAAANNVTIVGITETIQPPTYTFQEWMGAEYLTLYNALNANALGQ